MDWYTTADCKSDGIAPGIGMYGGLNCNSIKGNHTSSVPTEFHNFNSILSINHGDV